MADKMSGDRKGNFEPYPLEFIIQANVKDAKLRDRMLKLIEKHPNATLHELYVMAGRG